MKSPPLKSDSDEAWNKEGKEVRRWYMSKNRITRHMMEYAFWIYGFAAYLFVSPEEREGITEFLKLTFIRERGTGLLENSIISNPLYTPSDGATLSYEPTLGGRWAAFDFERKKTFGRRATPLKKGKVYSFVLDEIKDQPASLYTPIGLLRVYRLEHLLQMEAPRFDYLAERGLVLPATYRTAYQRVGLYDQYASAMEVLGISDKPVFQVTPKGNGLLFLLGDGGDYVEKRRPLPELEPATTHS